MKASVELKDSKGKGAKWFMSWDAFTDKLRQKGEIRENEEVSGVELTEKGIRFTILGTSLNAVNVPKGEMG